MDKNSVSLLKLPEFSLWKKIEGRRRLISFDIEVTARCNYNCRHCYINHPAGSKAAKANELSFEDIKEVTGEIAALGALWCLVTGGEPLLREDFIDIYLYLKRLGFLITVFTNASLITDEHVRLFTRYPPRNLEVTTYGVHEATYERVTRKTGSYGAFRRGLDLLLKSGIKVRLKTMALQSNYDELSEISKFCREHTTDYFRFDPFLHLRFDRDPLRNKEILSERLSPDQIVSLEQSDPERFDELKKHCDKLIVPAFSNEISNRLFLCGAGNQSFTLGYDGKFRLCSSLWHPNCLYDLHKGNLTDAWQKFVPAVRDMRSGRDEFLKTCQTCGIKNLCMQCPAHADLETGEMDVPVDYFCKVAHKREEKLNAIKTA